MADLAAAAAEALFAAGPYLLVTGRASKALQPLSDAADTHVISPGPSTRLAVAAGVALGGRRAVAVVDPATDLSRRDVPLAVTEAPQAAAAALRNGWSVVQASMPGDIAALLAAAPDPTMLLLSGDPGELPDIDQPAAAGVRIWQEGDLATLVASGAAVAPAVRLARRVRARGVEVTVLEVAMLTLAAQAPLLLGTALHVGGADAAGAVLNGGWPAQGLHRVDLDAREEADLVGAVLSEVRVT